MAASELDQILERIEQKRLPPVHLWNPELTGEMDMRIATDGSWYYRGSVISRPRMVRLFSTILRYEDGQHYLVTPVEKYQIKVDDAAFVANRVEKLDGPPQALVFKTNVDDEVVADAQHRIIVKTNLDNGQPRPYLQVRDGLTALIGRSVFYELVEWARPGTIQGVEQLLLESSGETFSLGQL